MSNPLTDIVPEPLRKKIYALYVTAGIVIGGIQVGFATAETDQPLWLKITQAVFGYLGIAVGGIAVSNVRSKSGQLE